MMFDLNSVVGSVVIAAAGITLFLHLLIVPPGPRRSHPGLFWFYWSTPAIAGVGLYYAISPVHLFGILCLYLAPVILITIRLWKENIHRPGYILCARCSHLIKDDTSCVDQFSRCQECGSMKWYGIRKKNNLTLNPAEYGNYGNVWMSATGAIFALIVIAATFSVGAVAAKQVASKLIGIDTIYRNMLGAGIWLVFAWLAAYLASLIDMPRKI